MARIEVDRPPDAGRRAYGGHLRPVADPRRQRPEPRLDVRAAARVRRAARAAAFGRRHRRGDPRPLPAGSAGGRRLGLRRAAHRRPGHHRRLQTHRRGPRQSRPRRIAARQRPDRRPAATKRPACKACSTARGPTRPGCISTSTAPSAWPWACRSATSSTRLQVYLGSFYVNNFNEFGRTWQVNVQADQRFRDKRSRHPAAPGRATTKDR